LDEPFFIYDRAVAGLCVGGCLFLRFGRKENPMTLQELQQTFERRAQDLKGFIYWKTSGNKDMAQEAMEAVWGGLQKDPHATDAYLRTRIRWRTRDVWKRGRSLDTHPASRVQASFCMNDRDAEDKVIAECIRDSHFPLDEQVINKVDSERFMNTLDMTERTIVLNKLKGINDSEVAKDLGMSLHRYGYIRDAIRVKIEDYFASK